MSEEGLRSGALRAAQLAGLAWGTHSLLGNLKERRLSGGQGQPPASATLGTRKDLDLADTTELASNSAGLVLLLELRGNRKKNNINTYSPGIDL